MDQDLIQRMGIGIVILTYNEEIHIGRCLENLRQISNEIYIVDAYSTDRTLEIAGQYDAKIFQNKWVNYAKQFKWALDNCGITTPWVMRMDADEYLESPLVAEIKERLPRMPESVTGIYLKRKVLFKGRWIKHGGFYPHILMRIWRNGRGNIEQRWMDEHVVVHGGSTECFTEHMVDENLNSIRWWVNKHNNYAVREMVDLLNLKYQFFEADNRLTADFTTDAQARRKRLIKERVYAILPPGVRATLYFLYRYFIRLGFLDGYYGYIFHFMQGYWYRLLVDVNLQEFEEKLNGDYRLDNYRKILRRDYNIELADQT